MQDTGARASTNTFVQRGIGDVLLAWENEALLAAHEMGADAFDIVRPSVSVLAEPPVAFMDSMVDRKGTRAVAEAYLDFLYAPEGQDIVARNFFRPTDAATAQRYAEQFPPMRLFTVDKVFGGWAQGASGALRRRRRLRPAIRGCGRGAARTDRRRPRHARHRGSSSWLPRRGWVSPSVLPGFGMTLGFAGLFLTFIVLIPMAALIIRASSLPLDEFWRIATEPRALASYRLTFGASLIAASLERRVRLHHRLDARPLSLSRAAGSSTRSSTCRSRCRRPCPASRSRRCSRRTAGSARCSSRFGIQVAYTWTGVVVALTLIGLPFVVRSVQPALEEVDVSLEEAAESLGASRWMVFRRVILPTVLPSLATGFTLALARAVGEYGSVIFIAGNLPLRTEITPL